MEFDSYVFSKQPGFVEPEMRKAFKQAVPLRTVVVYCYDPRAVNIPAGGGEGDPGRSLPRRDSSGREWPEDRFHHHDLPGCGRRWTRGGCAPFRNSRTAFVWNREHRCGAPHVLWGHVVHSGRSHRRVSRRAGCRHFVALSSGQHCDSGLPIFPDTGRASDPGIEGHAQACKHLRLSIQHRRRDSDSGRRGPHERGGTRKMYSQDSLGKPTICAISTIGTSECSSRSLARSSRVWRFSRRLAEGSRKVIDAEPGNIRHAFQRQIPV